MTPVALLLFACSSTPASEVSSGPRPTFDDADARRSRMDVSLRPVARGFENVTDVQFPPGDARFMVVLEKGGAATWVDLKTGAKNPLLRLDVRTSSELGLLGLAFHPKYAENAKVYVNYNPSGGELRTVISEWTVDQATGLAGSERVLLEVEQPYVNHDAGQLQFGPDGYLYVGLGDGGSGGDPLGHGQDRGTLLGDMLRIDVDRRGADTPYGIPADNPFVGQPGVRPEIWAWGLRNPWRYSFDPKGRLLVADVGQNLWEEVSVVSAGDNLGWNLREGRHCFRPAKGCPEQGLVDPIYEYNHDEGFSITGGYVSLSPALPALQGWYVFGDFGTGRIWALDVRGELVPGQTPPVVTLGRWPINPATFGRDGEGNLYVADFGGGVVYRMLAPSG